MRVLISGAGLAGLSLAAFLNRHDAFEVDIVEEQPDWSHFGYTIGIWDVGRHILAKLDKAEAFDDAANRITSYELETMHGDRLKLYHFDRFYERYESAYNHISRARLHEILQDAARSDIRMDTVVSSLSQSGGDVHARFSDGSTGAYDLVVGADGIRSGVRRIAFNEDVTHTGRRAWYAWVDDSVLDDDTALEIIGDDLICNLFADPQSTCAVFTAPVNPESHDDVSGRSERLRRRFDGFCSPVPGLLSSLDDEALQPTDIEYVDTDTWVDDRVVLIGDAAHAMEPFGGIGASMAMEDAYVLSEELNESRDGVSKALRRYVDRRRPRIEKARSATRQRYWWIHDSFPGMSALRRFLAPLVPVRHFTEAYEELLRNPP